MSTSSRLARIIPNCKLHSLAANARTSEQSITITGLGNVEFDRAIIGIQQLRIVMENQVSAMKLWEPRREQGHYVLTFSNRYFNKESEAANEEVKALSTDVDPLGLLAKAVPDGIHTSDNEVLYFERRKGDAPRCVEVLTPDLLAEQRL